MAQLHHVQATMAVYTVIINRKLIRMLEPKQIEEKTLRFYCAVNRKKYVKLCSTVLRCRDEEILTDDILVLS